MAVINWTLVEQRRVERKLSRATLAKRSGISEQQLLDFDEPAPNDQQLSLAQLTRLAAALAVSPSDLLIGEPEKTAAHVDLRYGWRAANYPRRPLTRFSGSHELRRLHAHTSPATGRPEAMSAAADAATLLAALVCTGAACARVDLADALHWDTARLTAAAERLTADLQDTDTQLSLDERDRWQLEPRPAALSPDQRRRLLRACRPAMIDAPAAALLVALHRHHGLRMDQIAPELRHRVTELEQHRLVQRRGVYYLPGPHVARTLALLDN